MNFDSDAARFLLTCLSCATGNDYMFASCPVAAASEIIKVQYSHCDRASDGTGSCRSPATGGGDSGCLDKSNRWPRQQLELSKLLRKRARWPARGS